MLKINSLFIVTASILLSACGCDSNNSSDENPPEIATYNNNYAPSNFTNPLITLKVTFANNVAKAELNKLSITAKISADDTPDGQGNELALFYLPKLSQDNSSTMSIKYTSADQVRYSIDDNRDTYYQVSNESGQLVLTIRQFGDNLIVGSTQDLLEAGNFRLNVEVKYHSDSQFSSVISTDYLPGEDVYTNSGYNFTDNENDYLDNDATADIVAVDVILNL